MEGSVLCTSFQDGRASLEHSPFSIWCKLCLLAIQGRQTRYKAIYSASILASNAREASISRVVANTARNRSSRCSGRGASLRTCKEQNALTMARIYLIYSNSRQPYTSQRCLRWICIASSERGDAWIHHTSPNPSHHSLPHVHVLMLPTYQPLRPKRQLGFRSGLVEYDEQVCYMAGVPLPFDLPPTSPFPLLVQNYTYCTL
jgi:hypothetical protein